MFSRIRNALLKVPFVSGGGKSHLGTIILSAVSEIWKFCMVIRSLLPISLETMHDPKEPVLLIALKIMRARAAC